MLSDSASWPRRRHKFDASLAPIWAGIGPGGAGRWRDSGFGRRRPATASPNRLREELSGLAYMFWGRLVALGMLAAWVALTLPFERSGLYLAAIVAFALLGAPPYLLARAGFGGVPVTPAFLAARCSQLC